MAAKTLWLLAALYPITFHVYADDARRSHNAFLGTPKAEDEDMSSRSPEELEATIMDLMHGKSGRLSGETKTSLKSIKKIIKSTMMPAVRHAHDAEQTALAKAHKAVQRCQSTKVDHLKNAKPYSDKYLNKQTGFSVRHKKCRQEQALRYQEHIKCSGSQKHLLEMKNLQCKLLDQVINEVDSQTWFESIVKKSAGQDTLNYVEGISRLVCGNPVHGPKGNLKGKEPYGYGGWLKGGVVDRYLRAKEGCDKATSALMSSKLQCGGKERAYKDKKAICDQTQRQMHDNACMAAVITKDACQEYNNCYKNRMKTFRSVKDKAKTGEKDRKAEWRGLKRIHCLINAFDDNKVKGKEIDDCKKATVDTSDFTLKYPDDPQKGKCDLLKRYPNTAEYQKAEMVAGWLDLQGCTDVAKTGAVEDLPPKTVKDPFSEMDDAPKSVWSARDVEPAWSSSGKPSRAKAKSPQSSSGSNPEQSSASMPEEEVVGKSYWNRGKTLEVKHDSPVVSTNAAPLPCTVPSIPAGVLSWIGKGCKSGAAGIVAGTKCVIVPAEGYACTSPGVCAHDGKFAAVGSCQRQCPESWTYLDGKCYSPAVKGQTFAMGGPDRIAATGEDCHLVSKACTDQGARITTKDELNAWITSGGVRPPQTLSPWGLTSTRGEDGKMYIGNGAIGSFTDYNNCDYAERYHVCVMDVQFSSSLTQRVETGSKQLALASKAGFPADRYVMIDKAKPASGSQYKLHMEINKVLEPPGSGPLVLKYPLSFAHNSGAAVTLLPAVDLTQWSDAVDKTWTSECETLGPYVKKVDLEACKLRCEHTATCTAIEHKPSGNCIMKACSSPVPKPTMPGAGYKGYHKIAKKGSSGFASNEADCFETADFKGGDIGSYKVDVSSAMACQKLCQDTADCRIFVYDPIKRRCWRKCAEGVKCPSSLYGATKAKKFNANRIAGPRHCLAYEAVFGWCPEGRWCAQSPVKNQWTRCEAVSSDGLTCYNPVIKYGEVAGGIPHMNAGNDFDEWCEQLGFKRNAAVVTYGKRSCSKGKVFWCRKQGVGVGRWCDWQDEEWGLNGELPDRKCSDKPEAITSLTCSKV